MNHEGLIKLITDYLAESGYKRNNNYETYSVVELLKVCRIYKIKIVD